ncbi:MAG: hypothetical protein TYPL_1930 [Candidatus Tyloplasma litorale]|nr:MAG: hypothetical protein TYPL_1930 [Mycoplasmatales bacterium]
MINDTKRKVFISFPYDEQKDLKEKILEKIGNSIAVDFSEKEDRSDTTDEYIWNNLFKRIKGS